MPACTKTQTSLPPTLPPAALHLSPLSDLIPAAAVDWLLVGKPSELLRTSSLGAPIAELLPKQNVDKLADVLGFDPRLTDDAVIAGFADTTLYLLRVAHDPPVVSARFRERITGAVEENLDSSSVSRWGGLVGTTHRSLADLEQSVIALEIGPPGPIRVSIAFAQGKLKRAHPALHTEPLGTLAKLLGDAPLLAMAPTPATHPWKQGAHGLLSRAVAMGLAVTPSAEGLKLHGVVMGAWDDPPIEATKRLSETLTDLMASPLGGLTGMRTPISAPVFGGDKDAIFFDAIVDPKKVADGLRDATIANISEIFGAPSQQKR